MQMIDLKMIAELQRAEHMSALWKRCAKKQRNRIALEQDYSEKIEGVAKRAERELEALKKDYAEIEDILGSDLNGYAVVKAELEAQTKRAEKVEAELRRLCEFIEAGQHMAAHVQATASIRRFEVTE